MEHITFEVPDKVTLDALKKFAASLNDVSVVVEEDEIFYPFSKDESERRLAASRESLKRDGGISLEQLKINIDAFKMKKLNGF